MNILEEAENLRKLAEESAKKRGITVQEAWNEAIEIFESRNNLHNRGKTYETWD
jgi:hypothetical protein